MQSLVKKWGKHVAAVIVFLVLSMTYFSPAVFDGKTLRQGDMDKANGMGHSQMDKYAKTAQPGEFSVWSDAMFGGMPYTSGYGSPAPKLPGYGVVETPLKSVGYLHAGMVFTGLICFYILMCVMGVNWWLAIAGALAFALASYNIIIIEAGHITKAYVIAYMPIVLAGMALLFRRKYLWGTVLFLLGVALSIGNGHIQITYYLVLLCLFIYIGYVVWSIKQKAFVELAKVTAVMAVCVLVAVLPNASGMYSNWDLGKNSTRGATELTTTTPSGEKISSGLDKDYAFQWSYGKGELLTLLVPNAYGGSSGGTLGSDSELYKELKAKGAQVGADVQTYTYWGDKPFTSGPVYFGALVCFLFVLGMFVIRNRMKWWMFAGSAFLILLAFGRNFDTFNTFMFHYLPMYNKFRTVEMALVIPGLVFPIIAIWGLKEILAQKVDAATFKRGMIGALAITGGLCLVVWGMPTMLLDFHSSFDAQYQLPDWYYNALLADRASMASADALRSLLFILAGAALLFWFVKAKNKQTAATVVAAAVAILILADLWTVDKRYLNETNFVNETSAEVYKPSVADNEIFKDVDPSYRVINLNNPFQETNTSYYHHSIGGYHAAKLRRYQELIDHRLSGELNGIMAALQQAKTPADVMGALAQSPSLNMLNTRYIIYNPEQPPLRNPFAYGNAWFVPKVEVVENADAEIAALNTINPLETAVVDKRFAADLKGFTPSLDSTARITLDSYRPNKLVYSTTSATDQLAVFSEVYYQPGWKATVDGKPVPHFRADWTLRAMLIPAGAHQVVFEFVPDGYIAAANIAAYGSFMILLLLVVAIGYSIWKALKKPEAKVQE
ncbi:MAG: YfhO family protein [Tannerellaceae bacterium]